MSDKLLLTEEELRPIRVKWIKDGKTNSLCDSVAQAQLTKLQSLGWGNIEHEKTKERKHLLAIASFTVRKDENTVVVDRWDWDRLIQALKGMSNEDID